MTSSPTLAQGLRHSLAADNYKLQTLARLFHHVDDSINQRAAVAQRLEACQHNGKVALVQTGRDAYGIAYVHRVAEIPANLVSYWKTYQERDYWADGPFTLHITRP